MVILPEERWGQADCLLEAILYVILYHAEIQFGYSRLELRQRLFSRDLIML